MIIKKYVACIFDENGFFLDFQSFKIKNETFKYGQEKSFIVVRDAKSKLVFKGLFTQTTYYFYDINNPFPINLKTDVKPEYYKENTSNEVLNSLLENDFLKKLNDIAKGGLFGNVDLKTIGIIGAIIFTIVIGLLAFR